MKPVYAIIATIFLLSNCNQSSAIQTTSTIIASTATITPTVTTTSTATQEVDTVEALLTAYLAGESIDVSGLNPTEFREFSKQLAEKRNAERGINPIIYNNEAYLSPDNYIMMNYDGHADMNETIQMYLPVFGKDGEGNLQIVNHDGETVSIENSANVEWSMNVTDPNDPRIDWPTTKVLDSGFVEAQYRVYHPENPTILIPAILVDNSPGQIYLSGDQPAIVPSLRFLLIETDDANNPILAREIINIGAPKYNLFEEGSTLDEESEIIVIPTSNAFFDKLQVNYVYYIGGPTNQTEIYNNTLKANIDAYRGIIDPSNAYPVILGTTTNYIEMLLLATSVLIKK